MENINNNNNIPDNSNQKIKNNKTTAHKILKFLKWFFAILVALYVIVLVLRMIQLSNIDKTNEQVEKIHLTKITIDDVMGTNLPSDPGEAGNKTVEGIDANLNGIRDDVELAIFKEYPDSAKTRAALLQYASVGQMILTQPFVNTVIATEVIREHGRANVCVADTLAPRTTPESTRDWSDVEKVDAYEKFVDDAQFNTYTRINVREKFYEKVRSFSSMENSCDFDYTKLPN
ncbi:MAG: hypothetical protein EOM85_02805 [Candidatus Moranbacteria bacterium]|nr:hypothetical protein [Candidatus Moranbacteria bacterium]